MAVSEDEETHSPTRGWANERWKPDRPEQPREPPEEPPRDPGEQVRPEGARYRRPPHRGTRDSPCPLPGCRIKTRRMREHVTLTHLHPLFLREVPCAPEITRARQAVLDWIRIRHLGPGTSLLELSAQISTREVFSCQAPIPEDIQEAMDALCVEVGEEPPSAYVLEGDLHPALMLHWRVQAYLVGRFDRSSRREYRSLLPRLKINGRPLRAFTKSRGLPPRAWRVVVEGWTPEVPQESPPGRRPRRPPGSQLPDQKKPRPP